MSDFQILLVDDDPALLEALSEALTLRMDGLSVETADSAKGALQRIDDADYDAIVVDIKMPGMDGLELLAEIKKRQPQTPVLLITGHGDQELAVQALRGGAFDYVTKPIDRDYFVSSLYNAIKCHRVERDVARQKQELEASVRELQDCVQDRSRELRELLLREQAARAELDEANRRLAAEQQRRAEFISMIAHDLGGPLTAIAGYAELLGRADRPPEFHERARSVIASETRRLSRLVADLAEAAHLEAGRFGIELAQCDLTELAREQVEVIRTRSDRHTIRLEAPHMLRLLCDRDRLGQVLANLLTNAINYTPSGEILVKLQVDGERAWLSVRDHGLGIPTELLETIFEPRYRLERQHSDEKPAGAGLGLHIVREIVEAHGGQIWVESTPGQGAEFIVMLPLQSGASHEVEPFSLTVGR